MSTVDDEIGLLADDIRRWAGADARIHDALNQLLKIYDAEVNALAFEAIELQRLRDADKATRFDLTPAREAVIERSITELENERIRVASHTQRVVWQKPQESVHRNESDWREHA